MKRNFIVSGIIALIVVFSFLVSNHIISAQRLDAQEVRRPTMAIQSAAQSNVIIVHSWLALSFKIGIDSETLAKVHPIYQRAYQDIEVKDAEVDKKYEPQMNELRTNPPLDQIEGQRRAKVLLGQISQEKRDISNNAMHTIMTSLQKVLNETQMSELHKQTEELLKQRMRGMPRPPNASGKQPQRPAQ